MGLTEKALLPYNLYIKHYLCQASPIIGINY